MEEKIGFEYWDSQEAKLWITVCNRLGQRNFKVQFSSIKKLGFASIDEARKSMIVDIYNLSGHLNARPNELRETSGRREMQKYLDGNCRKIILNASKIRAFYVLMDHLKNDESTVAKILMLIETGLNPKLVIDPRFCEMVEEKSKKSTHWLVPIKTKANEPSAVSRSVKRF